MANNGHSRPKGTMPVLNTGVTVDQALYRLAEILREIASNPETPEGLEKPLIANLEKQIEVSSDAT